MLNSNIGRPDYDMVALSLGAGVQSTAMYFAAQDGLIGRRPDYAIFADTQDEPRWVYEHLDRMEAIGSIPIRRATRGKLSDDVLASQQGKRWATVPFFVRGKDGKTAALRRFCSREYKVEVVTKEIRSLLGLAPRQRAKGRFLVEQWIGISTDEASRMKQGREDWIVNRHPLIEDLGWSRLQCREFLASNDYPVPYKSACVFCPYHDNRYWRGIKAEYPDEFERACQFDEAIRSKNLKGVDEDAFLHRSLVPLRVANIGEDDHELFVEECEGMCGV